MPERSFRAARATPRARLRRWRLLELPFPQAHLSLGALLGSCWFQRSMNDLAGSFEPEAGPSWARQGWPISELDELNLGLDPTQATIEKVKAAVAVRAAETTSDPDAIRRAAEDSIRAMMLIRTYRVRGHLAADLDPLRLTRREVPADLTAEYHGFSDDDLDRPVWLCGALGFEQATV